MSTSVTITPMLDEEDGTPVFEVRDESGNATNCVTIDEALETAKRWTVSVPTLEDMAKNWIIANGVIIRDNLRDEVEEEYSIRFTEDQWDSFCNMIEYSKVTVEFPYGWGTPPVDC